MEYEGIPCFSPEIFSWLRNPNPSAFKNFRKGVNELREEGAVQILYDTDESKRDPILAAVGQLQLEVVQHRLENEYGVETRLEPMGFQVARWINGGWAELEKVGRIFNCKPCVMPGIDLCCCSRTSGISTSFGKTTPTLNSAVLPRW